MNYNIDYPIVSLYQSLFNKEKFTEQLHFVIVGPGLMPIPPTGWGAVEILIWDYKLNIEKLGHKVTIINIQDMNEVVQQIKTIQPDIVHIQYDPYGYIANDIKNYARIIAITTHYGYFHRPEFIDMIKPFIAINEPNVFQFVLSKEIADVYINNGCQKNKIVICPNGANETLFQFISVPLFSDRSIYLAKIDYRKRQSKFQSIKSLFFAGNCSDNSFDTSYNYLGEWKKEYLYQNLSHYGNLVLLSDGEADPLVVKEALICGLGVVLSEFSIANLDISLPFITVISENNISDISFVEQQIITNRNYSVKNKEKIRNYGLTFSWSKLTEKYINSVKTILEKL